MKKRRLLALLMASAMLLSACGQQPAGDEGKDNQEVSQGGEDTGNADEGEKEEEKVVVYPDYLNLESTYPIVKDEYKDELAGKVTGKLIVEFCSKSWDELWIAKYLDEKYNVVFDMELISSVSMGEQKTLALNSGDMPDMMLNFFLTSNEIHKYGVQEGVLLPLDEYITKELCPNIYEQVIENEYVRQAITAPDGHIYSLPFLNQQDIPSSVSPRFYINEKYLAQVGKEMPSTLDEFIDVMYALKENDPSGLGAENFYPLGGGMEWSSAGVVLNAFGYIIDGQQYAGDNVALRDGEVVIPAYDMEVFQEYLKVMKQFYTDGILDPRCFTMDNNATNAELTKGALAVWANPVYVNGVSDWENWGAITPLTSDWQEEPETKRTDNIMIGQFVVSADTEYPELILRYADQYYNYTTDDAQAFWGNIDGKSEYAEGYAFFLYNEEAGYSELNIGGTEYPGGKDGYTYRCSELTGTMPLWGSYDTYASMANHYNITGRPNYDPYNFNLTDPGQFADHSIYTRVVPYIVPGFPSIYFTDVRTSRRLADLETVIQPYIREQVALFVTGKRDLSETGDFVKELEGMGIQELMDIYNGIMAGR